MVDKLINKNNINIGRCIYCGKQKEKLTDEHVIPYALGGSVVLKNASCENCRDITSRHEANPLSKHWAEVRAFLKYPSRKRKFDEETFKLDVVLNNGEETTLSLKREEILGVTQFLEYSLPGFFLKDGLYKSGVTVVGISTYGFGINIKEFAYKHNIKSFQYNYEYKNNNFECMVARIAYCFAVQCFGPDCFKERLVLPAILGQKDDIGYWFGGDPLGLIVPLIGCKQSVNAMSIGIYQKKNSNDRYVIVRLKFFANTNTPEYIVVAGSLKPDFELSKL